MTLIDVGLVANVATALAVIAGLAFGVIQLRQAERKRREATAVAVIQSFQTPEFRRAMLRIFDLPEAAAHETIRNDPQLRLAAETAIYTLEPVGLPVFERALPLSTVDRVYGDSIRASWRRLGAYVKAERRERGVAGLVEWYEWLAGRLNEYHFDESAAGAHVAHRDWRP